MRIRSLAAVFFLVCLIGASAVAEEAGTFKVGAILPLSGALAEYGAAARNGIELARAEHADAFRKVEFIYEDSKYDSKTAVSIYRDYAGQVSLFYVWGYSICQALAPIAESEKLPIVAASAEQSVSTGRAYVLRFNYCHQQISAALWGYLRSKGFKHIAVIKTELAYNNGVLDGMRKLMNAGESLDVVDTFDMGDMDFRTTVAKLRSKEFDALGVFLVGGQGGQFYKQAQQLKFSAQTFGTDFFDSDTVAEEAGGAMDGVVFATQEASKLFRARYKKTYGNDFQAVWAANSYEFAMLVAKLFGNGGARLSREQIMDKLRGSDAHSAGAAEYSYSNSKEGAGFDFKVALRKIAGKKVVDFHE